ncbi:hypothetical protein [Streptomyces sp. NPDC051098]|uniref:hypothetical protein n=1 Tax=Streptomyces sp. NPDC051098 TaxID=3155411 RepID=UPI003433F0D4
MELAESSCTIERLPYDQERPSVTDLIQRAGKRASLFNSFGASHFSASHPTVDDRLRPVLHSSPLATPLECGSNNRGSATAAATFDKVYLIRRAPFMYCGHDLICVDYSGADNPGREVVEINIADRFHRPCGVLSVD